MGQYQRTWAVVLMLAIVAGPVIPPLAAQDPAGAADQPESPWPRELERKGHEIAVYQPQPETFAGNKLTGRCAISITKIGEKEPRFGAVWLEARVSTDRDERQVRMLDLKVTNVRFPDSTEERQKQLAALLEAEFPKWAPEIDLDRLLTTLEHAEVKQHLARELKNDPPKMRFVTEPTELVILDGSPALRPVAGTKLMKVINTIYLLVLDGGTKQYYLNLGKIWMTAADLKGEWKQAREPPAEVAALTPPPDPDAEADKGVVPTVIVVEKPEELITTDGEPKYAPLPGNDLLYVTNTDGTILMDIGTQSRYVLCSGRWFRAKTFQGPWEYVSADRLPAAFSKIPADSDIGDVRAFVAGTTEAKDAVMDAQIPQTAAIKRDDKSLKVTYDGDPKFKAVDGVKGLSYATNTGNAVLWVEAEKPGYYCCHKAIWYVGASPKGPWTVATKVPDLIYLVPPGCPLYNVTYVRIYSVTPEVVYVGYLPGYNGSYVYGGTVVYGTGYTYIVWVGTVYYPRPVTYGYSYRYYPLLGRWFSPFSVGGVVRRTRRRTRRRHRRYHDHHRHHKNHYHKHKPSHRPGNKPGHKPGGKPGHKPSHRKNNHYADKKGNVHRRNSKGGWEQKSKSGWSKSSGRNSSMERQRSSRNRGNSRSQSRSSRGRGGGGRRR